MFLALYPELPRRGGVSLSGLEHPSGRSSKLPPLPSQLWQSRALRTSCKASQQWPGGECHPSAHWAENVNSDLVTHSGRMQSDIGLPSTLRALHREVNMLGTGGDLCRAEGPGGSSPKSYRHPVTRMNVTLRVCVWWGGGLLSSVPNRHSKHGHKMGECLSLTQQTSVVMSPETGVLTHDLTEVRIPQNQVAGLFYPSKELPALFLICHYFTVWLSPSSLTSLCLSVLLITLPVPPKEAEV